MRTIIDVETMESIIGRAAELNAQLSGIARGQQAANVFAASSVPGLDQLTEGHNAVLGGTTGSSVEVLDTYAGQLTWMHENLQAMKSGFVIQDSAVGKNLDRIGFGWMDLAASSVSFPARPAADFADFPFPTPSAGGHSLQSLSLAFAMTDTSAYHGMARSWRDMASRAEQISADIRLIVQDMVAHNEGEAIDAAQATITELGEAARAFSANASTMAASVETLVSIHSQGQSMVDSAIAELDAIEDPQERQAAHASLLDSFLVSFDNMLREGVPPINNLMQLPSSGGSGGSSIALGGSKHGSKSLSETSTPTIAGAGTGVGTGAGTGVASGAQFGQVNSNLDQLKGIGTQGAGVGGVTPGTVTGPQAPQAPQFGGMGTGGVGGVGAPRRLPPGTLDSSTGRMNGIVTSTGAGAGTGTGTGGGTGHGASAGAGNGLSAVRGGMDTGGMIAPGGFGTHGGHGGAGAGGTGTRGGLGTGGGAGVGRGVAGGGVAGGGSGGSQGGSIVRRSWSDGTIGRPPAGSPGVGSGTGAGAAGAGAGSGSGGGRPPMMGGVPMGAGRGGGEQNNQRPRPKSLNDIEREDNLRALLGPPIMWVPMAIYPPSSKKED